MLIHHSYRLPVRSSAGNQLGKDKEAGLFYKKTVKYFKRKRPKNKIHQKMFSICLLFVFNN